MLDPSNSEEPEIPQAQRDESPEPDSVPVADLASDSSSSAPDEAPGLSEPVIADAVDASMPGVPISFVAGHHAPPLPAGFQNLAARGGAIAALLLGLLAVAGAPLTPWSAVNAVLGISLGLWGLYSPLRKTAIAGLALAGLALVLCIAL